MPGFIIESPLTSPTALSIALVACTVVIHSGGTVILLWSVVKARARNSRPAGPVGITAHVTILVLALLQLHLLEVALWGAVYSHQGCFPDLRTSLYFSLISYATVGYGDILLNQHYRVLGGIEALAGVMMMSWSTAILIAYLQRVYAPLFDR
ncbi:MAG TPA: potassium channel family protein, partial [Verrucomicrobiae bacterium]|nr:potassium channel family protein [Verrucomicrobiae bacterium]